MLGRAKLALRPVMLVLDLVTLAMALSAVLFQF